MLSVRPIEHSTRIRNEAEALAARGYDVRVLSALREAVPGVQAVNGVIYEVVELRRPTRDAWNRYRSPGPRAGASGPVPVGPAASGARLLRFARRAYYAKNRLERVVYRAVREPARHHEVWMSLRRSLTEYGPDVVHAHDLATLYAGRRWARSRDVPLVYDSAELELGARKLRTAHERLTAAAFERFGVRAADAVITVSPEIADELARHYSIPVPAVVLNSPRLETRTLPPPFSLREACGLRGGERLIVNTGQLVPGRGLEHVVGALAHLPRTYHFAHMGPRKPEREEEFRAHVRALGVEDRVHLVDPVPGALVPATLAEADVAVIPHETEWRNYDLTLPQRVFHAVMAAVPIVTSRARAVSAFVRSHDLGVVVDEIDDPVALAAGLQAVVEHPPAGVVEPGRLRHLQETVCWESQAPVLFSLYDRLAPLPGAPPAASGLKPAA